MATGLPDSVAVEVEFTASVWTDVTTDVSAADKVQVRVGRATEFDDIAPSTCSLVLRNQVGAYTPDSGGSPYYPNVVEGKRLRVSITQAATTYRLFTGVVHSWEPNYSGPVQAAGTVTVNASDALAQLALHTLDSRWVEEARYLARTAGTWLDVWRLDGAAATTQLDNVGLTIGAAYGTATVVAATSAAGSLSFGTPDALIVEGQAGFSPASAVGSVISVTPAAGPGSVAFWLQVPADTLPGPSATLHVLAVRGPSGALGSLRLRNNGSVCELALYTSGGAYSATLVAGVADEAWRLVSLTDAGATTTVRVATAAATATATAAFDLGTATGLYLGGETASGAPTACAPMAVAGLVISGATTTVPAVQRGLPGQTDTQLGTFTALQHYCPEVTSWATMGGEVRTIGEPAWAGSTALDVFLTIARTVSGVGYCTGDGAVTLAMADVVRPGVSAATLDIELDVDHETTMPQLRRAADSRPTRVAVEHAGGTTTLVDVAAEAAGQPRREQSLKTCAADVAGATFAGQYLLTAANGLRITSVAVDLTSSVTNLWATCLGLYPTQRLTVGGFNAALMGSATHVVFVQGWTATIDHLSVVYVFDCSPAAQFPMASWDAGDEYGRWSGGTYLTVTGGTAIGTTANGTLVVTIAGGGVGLSLNAGDYPMVLDWAGEYVQVTTPPVSSASPQTVTTTQRGYYPTAARSTHVAGEAVDVYHAAIWGF